MYIGKMFVDENSYSMHPDLEEVRQFPLGDGDVIVAGYPKSGTNWVQIMLANLWDDWTTTQNEFRRVPNMAGKDRDDYQGYLSAVAAGSPRLMKTHLHREAMPYAWPEVGKVIHVTRDPRDVCVSQFAMLNTNARVHPDDPDSVHEWDTWVDRFVDGHITCGPYLDSVTGWNNFEHPNLMNVFYEDVKADPEGFLTRACAFIGREASAEAIAAVVHDTHPSNMKNNDALRHQINVPEGLDTEDRPFIRTGGSGGWRNDLSEREVKAIEDGVMRPMQEAGIDRYTF